MIYKIFLFYNNPTNCLKILCLDNKNNYYYYDTFNLTFHKFNTVNKNIYFIEYIKTLDDLELLKDKYKHISTEFVMYNDY